MNKFILFLGKLLISISVLWPIPFGFICEYSMKSFDRYVLATDDGYWWPVLYTFSLGVLLCLISRYKGKWVNDPDFEQATLADSFVIPILLKIFKWVMIVVGGFWAIVLFLVSFHYLFLTDAIEWSIPTIFLTVIVAGLFEIGRRGYVAYKREEKKQKKKENQNNR